MNEQQIKQIRLNALSAKYIHTKEMRRWKRYNLTIDILTFIVPVLLLVFPILHIDRLFGISIDSVNGVLSVLLLTLAVLKLLVRIPDRIEKYQRLLTENITLANEAQNILLNASARADKNRLYQQAQTLEIEDQELIGNVRKKLVREAYREALKELDLGDSSIVCPVCKASPWIFKKGNCEACGNTPANDQ